MPPALLSRPWRRESRPSQCGYRRRRGGCYNACLVLPTQVTVCGDTRVGADQGHNGEGWVGEWAVLQEGRRGCRREGGAAVEVQ